MAHGTKSNIPAMVAEQTKNLSKMPAHVNGWTPVVFVGQVSARSYMVGTCYQPKGLAVGDTFKPAEPRDFVTGTVYVAAIG